jgi:acyl-CoA synthetase (AMP-forming)/AMP-acid ligase II
MSQSSHILEAFLAQVRQHPDRMALVEGDRQITYAELAREIRQTAAHFQQKGIRKGDRVLVLVPMSIDLYRNVLALFYMGAVAVFLDEWVSFPRLKACCRLVSCQALLAPLPIRALALLSASLRKIPIWLGPGFDKNRGEAALAEVLPEHEALITFTTGTTGIPKAANRTHGFLQAQFDALKPLVDNGLEADMPLLPIVLLLNLGLGKTSVIERVSSKKPFHPDRLVPSMLRNQVQSLSGSPYFLVELTRYVQKEKVQVPDLKSIITGGGPLFPDEAEEIARAFPNVRLTIVYGSTESEPISHVQWPAPACPFLLPALPAGFPDPAATVCLIPFQVGPVTEIQPLAPGEAGELLVSGRHVLSGYIKNPEADRQHKIRVHGQIWHRTGDAARMDTDGRIWLLGRAGERFVWKGQVYFPFELELLWRSLQPGGRVAALANGSQVRLLFEGQPDPEVIRLFLHQTGLEGVEVLSASDLPRDPRHKTRLDIGAIRKRFGA